MYTGHGRLCVCLSLAAFPHYCTDPDVTLGNGSGCPLVVHYWADLQSVHGFRCYDNVAPNAKCQRVPVLDLCPVYFGLVNQSPVGRSSWTGWLHDVTVNEPESRRRCI